MIKSEHGHVTLGVTKNVPEINQKAELITDLTCIYHALEEYFGTAELIQILEISATTLLEDIDDD